MAKPDLYSASQAAKILGLSVKRVRQMLEEGKLKAYSVGPIRIRQLEILAMRNEREAAGKGLAAGKGAATNSEVLAALHGLNESFTRQLEAISESNRRNEENYLQQINDLRAQLAQASRKRFFRR